MKQDMQSSNAPSSNDIEKVARPTKNLYEPYITPTIAWVLLRNAVIVIFAIAAHMHIRGRHNVPKKGPYIIASNHLSWVDIPLIPAYISGKVVYMAKEEAFLGKLSWLVRFLGAFPVKRGEADRQAIRAANEQLKKGRILVIFPEGHRSETHTLGKIHSGLGMIALRAGVPVVPVAVSGSENLLKKFGTHVTVTYGEPVVFKPKGNKITREDIDDATSDIMRRIATMLPPSYRGAVGEALVQGAKSVQEAETEE
ncbi:MAG TPA: lysophospholipid acyltransferase family protein [Ktedonobacteraceae bacterium]|jgi:1-acyl-sn-glycerol-3-phosphate acyltransferase